MPDILIRGMEMPPEGEYLTIEIAPDGTIWKKYDGILEAHAEELPPHGDLIDRNAVIEDLRKDDTYQNWAFRQMLGKQPVVVPAEREGEA